MERWLQERRAYAEALRQRVQNAGSPTEAASLDRFLRQTARMQATADQLERNLPSAFGKAHGLRLHHSGQDIYLEHLVVGPTGIFLIETFEGDDPAWLTDLARNITYFRQILGRHASFFTCLVVSRSASIVELPEGVRLVDSVEMALDQVLGERQGTPVAPELAREVWYAIQVAGSLTPMRPWREGYWERVGRAEQVFVAMLLVTSLVLAAVDKESGVILSFVVAVVLLILPGLVALGLILLIPDKTGRKVAFYILATIAALWSLLLVAAVNEGSGTP
ncbi:MAG: nuclease-related domain-containing protein [Bacillota bacterium]